MSETDAQLVILAQDGDSDAFEALHARLLPGLRRFAYRLVGDALEAEDITQEALLTLYLHLSHIDPPEHVRAYVYRIVRNRCYDSLRRDGRRGALSLDQDEDAGGVRISFELPDSRATPPEEAAHWLLLGLEVREMIDTLPENQQQTLMLFAESELTYQEIAEVLGVSIGTVKSRLFHAKRTLRGRLRPQTLAAIRETLDEDDDDLFDEDTEEAVPPMAERRAGQNVQEKEIA
ncbi:MAG: sigma-70 family RNA polymerase sigma factor [Anaerolineae bacterium]|nr:sigma-70 family RNA polymerase sigma factor [Anaerolineae bacterium]